MSATWEPYTPRDYPIQGNPHHNPWVVIDPISKMTGYDLWLKLRPVSRQEFEIALFELQEGR